MGQPRLWVGFALNTMQEFDGGAQVTGDVFGAKSKAVSLSCDLHKLRLLELEQLEV